ncbi:MAG: DUF86 domain-containing protein [Spirochaetales bacterium]|nr:DUF86 domain-containing protein [Spirochaetales bacterium]
MPNERDSGIILRMIEHCTRIEEIRERLGNSFESFTVDQVFEDAINMNIFQIGELSNQLSDDFRKSVPDIPWHRIYGIRNVIAHAYVIVDKRTIWETVERDIPDLRNRLKRMVEGRQTSF